jgi:hypothetical protein
LSPWERRTLPALRCPPNCFNHNRQSHCPPLAGETLGAPRRHQQGKRREAHELLASVYGWFTEGFETADLQEAKALLEELGD